MVNQKKDDNQKRFSESQKRRIVSEVVSGELNKEEARRRYKIRSNSAILEWMRIFAGGDRKDANFDPIEKIREMPKTDKRTQELQAKIKRLEEELELSELRSLAYKSLVEIAKEDYGLDLEKKSGVKRSGKLKQ